MTLSQPTSPDTTPQDPYRWARLDAAQAFDHFRDPGASSQRQYAKDHHVPRSTLGHWMRRDDPATNDPVAAFCHSAAGQDFLRGIVLAALTTFCLQGACGIRLLSDFLRRGGLDRFVAPSRGALQPLLAALEAELAAFDDLHSPELAAAMPAKTVAVAVDEHFHAVKPCLVAIEPVSNFILLECYRDNRNAQTWEKALRESIKGMSLTLALLTSDLALGLLCCATKGLQVPHSPDLFHGQQELLRPLLLPLARPIRQAQEDLEKAQKRTDCLDEKLNARLDKAEQAGCADPVRVCEREISRVAVALGAEDEAKAKLAQARSQQEQAVAGVRGVGDDYHPFDRQTGQALSAQEVEKRLLGHVAELGEVVEEAGLGEKPRGAVEKGKAWVATLVGCVAWFWVTVNSRLEELDLSEAQEQQVREKLLPGHYWEMAAPRARTAEERSRLKEMAGELKKGAWQKGGELAALSEEKRGEVERVAKESAGLFARSSSCVEGRNGRLSLQHHGHGKVSAARLKALRVVHNYLVRRPDGSTAAERFFGQKHPNVFSWLLDRMPDLPRPAAKRPPKATQPALSTPTPG